MLQIRPQQGRIGYWQLGMMDVLCVITLHIVVLLGVRNLIKTLATHYTITFPDGQFGGDEMPPQIVVLDHRLLLVLCVCAGSAAIWTGFFAGRYLLRSFAEGQHHQRLCRGAACIGCVLFFLVLLLNRIGIPAANMGGSQDGYWIIADGPARRNAFLVAMLVAVLFIAIDAILNQCTNNAGTDLDNVAAANDKPLAN